MRRIFSHAVLICLALSFATATGSGEHIVLGVLEDVPGAYLGEPHSYGVRVAFQKNGSNWQAFPTDCADQSCLKTESRQYPDKVVWNVAFDGRKLGEVTGQTPKEFRFYSYIGLQEIKGGIVPTVGKRSAEYGGFTGVSVYRPLLTNAQPYFEDPEAWKSTQLTADTVRLLREQFRKKFPTVSNCANPDENVAKPWRYRDEDIRVLKAFSSKRAWSLARLRLEESRCDGFAGDAFLDQWFAISPALGVTFLDAGMWLVDAGDYDNGGRSELVFSIDRYNRGGYELFYDDFKKRAIFEFGYQ